MAVDISPSFVRLWNMKIKIDDEARVRKSIILMQRTEIGYVR
jgi:hypothetical protein